jgi:hypothetical protein
MKKAIKNIALGVVCIGAVLLVVAQGNRIPIAVVIPESLTEFEGKAIDLYAESLKLLNSFALLVVGGVGFFVQLIFAKEGKIVVTVWVRFLLVLAMVLAGVSLVFGYESYVNMVDIVAHGSSFDLASPRVAYFQQLQFWAFAGAVASFGSVSIHMLFSSEVQGEPVSNVGGKV